MDIYSSGVWINIFKFVDIKSIMILNKTNKSLKYLCNHYGYQINLNRMDMIREQLSGYSLYKEIKNTYDCKLCQTFSLDNKTSDVHFRGNIISRFCNECIKNTCDTCTRCKKVRPKWFLAWITPDCMQCTDDSVCAKSNEDLKKHIKVERELFGWINSIEPSYMYGWRITIMYDITMSPNDEFNMLVDLFRAGYSGSSYHITESMRTILRRYGIMI